MKLVDRRWCAAWLVAMALLIAPLGTRPAEAHPHVWVSVTTTVLYESGRISGFKQSWTFDDMYTAMAIQGLDANGDGTYSREELQELAQVNMDGLKEFSFFTYAKVGETALKIGEPKDYWLEHKDGILTLHFTAPLAEPVLADAEGFAFAVYDETFFIAFELAKDNPVRLSEGAPPGCAPHIGVPPNELSQLQALNDAFGGQLTTGDQNEGMGAGYAKTVTIGCKNS